MDVQRLQDELDNLEMFVLPEAEARLADVRQVTEDDPDWEYRVQDEHEAMDEVREVKSRIATIKARLTKRAGGLPSASAGVLESFDEEDEREDSNPLFYGSR